MPVDRGSLAKGISSSEELMVVRLRNGAGRIVQHPRDCFGCDFVAQRYPTRRWSKRLAGELRYRSHGKRDSDEKKMRPLARDPVIYAGERKTKNKGEREIAIGRCSSQDLPFRRFNPQTARTEQSFELDRFSTSAPTARPHSRLSSLTTGNWELW